MIEGKCYGPVEHDARAERIRRYARGAFLATVLGGNANDASASPSKPDPVSMRAPSPNALRHKLQVGFSLGSVHPSAEMDGAEYDQTDTAYQGGLMLAFEERVHPRLSVAARASALAMEREHWAHPHQVRDLGLETKLWFPPIGSRYFEAYASLLAGLSVPLVAAREHRAFRERVSDSSGYHVGGAIGFAHSRKGESGIGWGLFMDVGYQLHVLHVRAILSPRLAGGPDIVEDWTYYDGGILLTFGGAFGFGSL